MHSNNRVKNIEIPENLFSNLGEIKKDKNSNLKKTDKDTVDGIKLTNYSKHNEYRDRISKMYDSFDNLIPIDSEIDNVLYFNNYIEKGIVVKPKVSSLKQFWTEYRLIKNERKLPKYHLEKEDKNKPEEKEIIGIEENDEINTKKDNIHPIEKTHQKNKQDNKLTNFDKLFDALSQRVEEINSYIDELKEMRININESNNKLEEDKEKFKEEKEEFLNFKAEEEIKINKEKETLKINYNRLQNIIDDLDKKLNEIDN